MNLQSVTSARLVAAQDVPLARQNRSAPGAPPTQESSPVDRLPEPVRRRIEEKRAKMSDRLDKAMDTARGPRARERLHTRMSDVERAMNARIDAMIATRGGPNAGPLQPTGDPAPGANPGVNQAPAATQADRRSALTSRITASASGMNMPDSVMARIAAMDTGSVDPAEGGGRSGRSFLDAFAEAVDLLRDRGNKALAGAENENQRRIIEERVTLAISDMASRLRDALSEGRGSNDDAAETGAGRSSRALSKAAEAGRTGLASRVNAALAGAETDNQRRILGDRADSAASVMEERIERAMLEAGFSYEAYQHDFSGGTEPGGQAVREGLTRFRPIPLSSGRQGLLAEAAFQLRS